MHLSTNDQIELCEIVANKISELAQKRGKNITADNVFNMIFDGDYCDIFDNLLSALDEGGYQ